MKRREFITLLGGAAGRRGHAVGVRNICPTGSYARVRLFSARKIAGHTPLYFSAILTGRSLRQQCKSHGFKERPKSESWTSRASGARPARRRGDRMRAARVHLASRRRGGVAAGGGRAADGDAGDRGARCQIAWRDREPSARISPGPEGHRLCRGRERHARIPLGRKSTGSVGGAGGRIGSPAGRRDRRLGGTLRRSRPRQQPRRSRSSSPSAKTRSDLVLSPASPGRGQPNRHQFFQS